MDVVDVISILSRWVHLLSVVVAVGGAFFVRFALFPAIKGALSPEDHDKLRAGIRPVWSKIVHVCLGLLVVTGGINLYVTMAHGVKPMPYHAIFGVKLILVLVLFFIAVALTGTSPGFASLRANAPKWLGVHLFLATCIVLLSGVLKSIHQAALTIPLAG